MEECMGLNSTLAIHIIASSSISLKSTSRRSGAIRICTKKKSKKNACRKENAVQEINKYLWCRSSNHLVDVAADEQHR